MTAVRTVNVHVGSSWHTDVKLLSVNVFCQNSFVQQHWRGKSLPGQRQRQVSSRHDHLPIPDHLPAVEQHGGRRQVSGFKWQKVRWLNGTDSDPTSSYVPLKVSY